MLTRFQYYFRKKVLADDLNELQGSIEAAIDRNLADRGMYGLASSVHTVIASGAAFNLSVNSGGASALFGYDRLGRRVSLSINPEITPELSGFFTLPGGGNEKWITLILRAVKDESQPETQKKPPVFTPVNFRLTEGFEFAVLEGAEVGAPAGPGDKPSLAAEDGLYLADILLEPGFTDFTTATIETDRKRVDPLFDVFERGADGVNEQIALISDAIASDSLSIGPSKFDEIDSIILIGAAANSSDTGNVTYDFSPFVDPGDIPVFALVEGFFQQEVISPTGSTFAMITAADVAGNLLAHSLANSQIVSPSLVVGASMPVPFLGSTWSNDQRRLALVPVAPGGPPWTIDYRMSFLVTNGFLNKASTLKLAFRGYVR